jgi:hypothetical protein
MTEETDMRTAGDVIVGWLDTSIGTVVRHDAGALTRFAYWLVTSVDSSTDLPRNSTARAIVERYEKCAFLGQGLVLPGADAPAVAEEFDLFNGFDEVWFFQTKPEMAKSAGLSIVSPLNLGSDPVPPLLTSWMKQSGCELGLGDGIGLNYATYSEASARLIEDVGSSRGQLPSS